MSSTRQFVIALIEMYKEHTCLWKKSDPGYHDKMERNAALEKLLKLFKTVEPAATKEVVSKKLNSVRGSFRKELNKVRASQRSGDDDVHVPKLWYFDRLKFLADQGVGRPSSPTASVQDDMPLGYDESDDDDDDDDDDAVETYSHASSSSSRPQKSKTKLKRLRTKADHEKMSRRTDQRLESPLQKERFASFGEHVAERLRYMPAEMVPICQKLISDSIFQGEMKLLNISSRIVTDCSKTQPSLEQPFSDNPAHRGGIT